MCGFILFLCGEPVNVIRKGLHSLLLHPGIEGVQVKPNRCAASLLFTGGMQGDERDRAPLDQAVNGKYAHPQIGGDLSGTDVPSLNGRIPRPSPRIDAARPRLYMRTPLRT